MGYFHRIFGHYIKCDYLIPGLFASSIIPDTFIKVSFKRESCRHPLKCGEIIRSIPQVSCTDIPSFEMRRHHNTYYLIYGIEHRCVDITYDMENDSVDILLHDDVNESEVFPVIFGQLIALILRLKNKFILHGTTLAKGDKGITLCGVSGSGKSTLAAYLYGKGYSLVSDDVTVFTDSSEPEIYGGLPVLRLNQDTKDFCLPDAHETFWDTSGNKVNKNYYTTNLFSRETVASSMIFFLKPLNRTIDICQTEMIGGASKIMNLLEQSYGRYVLSPQLKKSELFFSNKFKDVPLFYLEQPDGFDALKETHEILDNLI